MKKSDWHFSIAAALLTLGLAAAGCGSGNSPPPAGGSPDAGPDDQLPPPPEGDGAYVYPDVAHTGFDGMHDFKVPISTGLTGTVTWEIADPSIISIAPATAPAEYADFGETWAMVTSKKAGTTKVTAVSGSKRAEGMIIVSAYTAADVTAGAKRYTMPDNAAAAQRTACASCHALGNGVDHSPLKMAYFADDEIQSAITTGKYPDGYELHGVNHAWNLAGAEVTGIVPYLRSLPPKGF